MSFVLFSLLIGIFLAYANGANDNFKGLATLYGSGTTTYKKALAWAMITTLLGSLAIGLAAAWLITLPVAMILSGVFFLLLREVLA